MEEYLSVYERLQQTERCLALGADDIRFRLNRCAACFVPLRGEDFPEELREDFREIMAMLTRKGPHFDWKNEMDYGSIHMTLLGEGDRATKTAMHKDTAVKIAQKLMLLKDKLQAYTRE